MLENCQIVYHPKNCLNTKKPFAHPCRLCIEACPHQAISENREINSKKCTECGVCMAVCPSDGLVDRNTDELHQYIDQGETVVLNCPQANPLGFEIPCLGIIDRDLWTTLILKAGQKKVEIHTGKCAECPDKKACAQSVREFKELHQEWPEHPTVVLRVSPDTGEVPGDLPLKPSQADKNQGWKEKSWDKLESILPGLTADETYPIPRTRLLLTRHLEGNPNEKVPVRALMTNDQCTSCGVCAAICPQGALTKKEEGEKFSLIYEPFKCVRCQRCVRICKPEALSFRSKPLAHRFIAGKIRLHEGSQRHCIRCGKQVFDRTEPPLCVACASTNPDEKGFFW